MLSNIALTLMLLLVATFCVRRFSSLPNNVLLLFLLQPLVMAASPVIVFIGGILSTQLTPDNSLATLPVTIMILGVASAAIPAAMLAKKLGRKQATFIGFSIGLVGNVTAMLATQIASFSLFCLAAFLLGACTAFIQQLRFAAIESTEKESQIPSVLSLLMLSGIFSAFLGPEIAVAAKDWIDSPYGYTGSFTLIAVLNVIAMIILSRFKNPNIANATQMEGGRPLLTIVKQPIFIIALTSAAIGFALMSYLMTATPLSMHQLHGHSLHDTKWVIQTHIAAMFLPSLITGWLINKIGLKHIFFLGTLLYAIVAVVAFSGEQVIHYWWALLLLGVGWNFLFLTGTTLLPKSYSANERHKVQALNDFVIFSCQGLASLMAGWVLFQSNWTGVVSSSLPFIAILFITSIWFYRRK